jgi:hypothetical protein
MNYDEILQQANPIPPPTLTPMSAQITTDPWGEQRITRDSLMEGGAVLRENIYRMEAI